MSDALVEIAGTLVTFSIEMSDKVKEMFVAVSRTVLTSFVTPPCKIVTIFVSLDSDKLVTVSFVGSGSVAINCVVV